MRIALSLLIFLACSVPKASVMEPCVQIHGRARLYTADGQLRIWHIGTHHEFEPLDKASWYKLLVILLPKGVSGTQYDLFADFTHCPTQPFKQGWVRPAEVRVTLHEHVIPWPK